MRLLVVSQYFWPESVRINDLVDALLERNHSVTVLTGQPNYPTGRFYEGYGSRAPLREGYRGAHVERVPLIPRGDGSRLRMVLNYLSWAATSTVLAPRRVADDFDVILVHQPSPLTVALPAIRLRRRTGRPLVLWALDLWPDTVAGTGAISSERIMRVISRFCGWVYARCDHVLIESRAFRDVFEAFGVPKGLISYFPNWPDDHYRPVEPGDDDRRREGIPDGFTVMFAGNLGMSQSLETILDAARILSEHRDIHWVIVGDGSRRKWVEERIARDGLINTVHLLGRRPASEMPRLYSMASACLVTLRRAPVYALTLPSKIQAYMACGRPIVAAMDGEGARVITDAGAGVVGPAEDADTLARHVLELFRMPVEAREAMGRRGLAWCAAHFSRSNLMDELEKVLERVSATASIR